MDLMQLSTQMIILCRQASVWDNCRASTNEAFVVQEQEKCHTGMETFMRCPNSPHSQYQMSGMGK